MREKVSRLLGTSVENCVQIAQNRIAEVYICDGRFVIKHSQNTKFIELEAKMLNYLKEHSLPVPEVYYIGENMLITQYIANDGSCSSGCEKQIARELAALHKVKSESFGFDYDTTIGPFIQPNSRRKSWVQFYKEMRVEAFAKEALKEGSLNGKTFERVMKLAENLERLLIEPKHPSLIHGDVWSGNVLTRSNRLAAFIDPAIYYASNEIELAFIAMFHTFGKEFYKEYDSLFPIADGFFENRLKLYQIYPYLVHIRAFGGTYLQGLENILNRYGY